MRSIGLHVDNIILLIKTCIVQNKTKNVPGVSRNDKETPLMCSVDSELF